MAIITLELPEKELTLFMELAKKLNATNINIHKQKQVEKSPLFWLEQLRDANINSSIENPTEWQREIRVDRVLPFLYVSRLIL